MLVTYIRIVFVPGTFAPIVAYLAVSFGDFNYSESQVPEIALHAHVEVVPFLADEVLKDVNLVAYFSHVVV